MIAAALVVALVAGWVGFATLRSDDQPDERRAVPVTSVRIAPSSTAPGSAGATRTDSSDRSVESGPVGDSSGIPLGYGRSEAGARAAAVGWVSSLGMLMGLGPIATAETLRSLTSGRVAAATVDSFRTERARFTEKFGADPSRALWIESPLTVQVVEWNPDRAVVRVWSHLVVGAGSGSAAQVLWRTHTVSVVWEHADWRVDDVTRVEGPTPQTAGDLPSPGSEFTAIAAWTPAVLAGSTVKGG